MRQTRHPLHPIRRRRTATGRRRSAAGVSTAVALALVASLLTVLPSLATTPFGADPAGAGTHPSPAMAPPACDPVTGEGLCVRDEGLTITVGGEVNDVGSVLNVGGSGLIPCVRATWAEPKNVPNPCQTRLGTTVTGCLVYDLWDETLERGPGFVPSNGESDCQVEFSEAAPVFGGTRSSCSAGGNFATYIYGGPANVPGARFSEWVPAFESGCVMTVTDMPTSLDGPAWLRLTRDASCNSIYCLGPFDTLGDTWVRVNAPVRNRGAKIECDVEDLGDGAFRFRITDLDHPLDLAIDEMVWSWDSSGEEIGDGMSVEIPTASEDRATVRVTDSDGVTTECDVVVPEPTERIDVSLTRRDTDTITVNDEFTVDLTISAPPGNPGDVYGVTTDELLVLPDFLELVGGDMATGFDLVPGDQRTASLTIEATAPGDGNVSSTWSAMTGDAETIDATGEVSVEVIGTVGGEWFREDLLGEYVLESDTADVRLRIENESGVDLSAVTLVDAVVVAEGTDDGGGDPMAVAATNAVTIEPDGGSDSQECPEGPETDAESEPLATLSDPDGALRGTLDATGPGSVDFLDFELEGIEPGEIQLCAEVTATTAGGDDLRETIEATWEVKAVGLDVEIEADLRREDGTAWELNTDNDGDGDVDEDDHRFPVEVEITNTTDLPITDISWLDEAEPIDWSNNLTGEDQGAPKLTFLGHADGLGDGDAGTGGLIPAAKDIPDLAASGEEGDRFEVTYYYEATGEVDADGQVVVLGAQDGANVRGSGEVTIEIVSGILLEFTTWLEDPFRLTTSGQVVRLEGYVENLDEDEIGEDGEVVREARAIAVWITPLLEGNAGGGHLVTRDGGKTPNGAEFIKVEPGEKLDLHGIVSTLASPKRTDAEIRYLVDAWQVPEVLGDTALELPEERIDIVIDEEKGWGDEHSQRLQFADLKPDDLKACESHFYVQIASCNFVEGLRSLYFNTVDAAKMAEHGVGEIGSSTYWVGAWAVNQLQDVGAALRRDPAAVQRLADELEVQLETWKQMGILTVDTGVSAVGVIDNFLAESERVWDEGDTEAGLAWISKFAGENPDLLFSAILKARTLAAMGQSMLKEGTESAAATAVRESVEAEARAAQAAIGSKVDDAIARNVDPKKPSSGILRSGMDITGHPRIWRDVYGAARDDIQKLLQIAREENILVAFRSRHPRSIELLEQGLAWLKPQSVKAKNVSAIDVKYFGFPEDSLGKVVMLEPPVDFRLTGKELQDAIDAHMSKLRQQHPELANDVWAKEVRERLEMRAEKYTEHLSEWLEYADTGMPVGFDGSANNVSQGSLNVTEYRDARLEVTFVPDPYNPGQTLTRYDLKIAGPGGGDYRHLTGDIDVVGFFNLDRTPIMGEARRARIYEKMRATGMQHGETLTWDHKKRAELLREHIGDDAELLVVASPDDKVYLSQLDEKKSSRVYQDENFKSTFSLLDGPPVELQSPVRGPGPAPSGALVRTVATNQTVQALSRFKKPAEVIDQLKKIAEQSDGQITVQEQQSKDGPPVVVLPDGRMIIYRVPDGSFDTKTPRVDTRNTSDARPASGIDATRTRATTGTLEGDDASAYVAAVLGDYRHTHARPSVGRLGGIWEETTFAAAVAEGAPGTVELPLTSWSDTPLQPGATSLSVLTAGELGVPGGDWFAIGDRVVFDPGGAYEQVLTLTGVDGHLLMFDEADALLPDHRDLVEIPMGYQVVMLPAATTPGDDPDPETDPETDPGTDPETDPGTDPESGPGTGPGTEVDTDRSTDGGDTPGAESLASPGDGGPQRATRRSSGGLAFTGADAIRLAMAGLLLLVVGIVLRSRRGATALRRR